MQFINATLLYKEHIWKANLGHWLNAHSAHNANVTSTEQESPKSWKIPNPKKVDNEIYSTTLVRQN